MQFLRHILFILLTVTAFSQIPEIIQVNEDLTNNSYRAYKSYNYSTLLGKGDSLYSFFVYRTKYTYPSVNKVFYSVSSDYGKNWGAVKEISTSFTTLLSTGLNDSFEVAQLPNGTFVGALRTENEDLMILKSPNLEVLDSVLVFKKARSPEFTLFSDGTILLTYHKNNNSLQFRRSEDNGVTWSSVFEIADSTSSNSKSSIQQIETNHLITSYLLESSLQSEIVLTESFDNGISWDNERVVFSGDENLRNPYMSKSGNGTLWLVFQRTLTTTIFIEPQLELFFMKSTDDGNSWSEPNKFTSFVGNDKMLDISNSNTGPLLTFASNRVYSNKNTIHLGVVGESFDPSPPVIIDFDYENFTIGSNNNIVNIKAEDDETIEKVYLTINKVEYELYDDGFHNDENAGDNIFGNDISEFGFGDLTTQSFVEVNNIYLPFNNRGILGDVNVEMQIDGYAIDNANNEVVYDTSSRVGGSSGKYSGKAFLWSGGFFLSGFQGSELWANGVASAALIKDYVAGQVNKNENNDENIIYSVFENDIPFSESWQNWKSAVKQGAYFYDGDFNGKYEPVDKNNNGEWDANEDKPDILYDVNYFTVYNDGYPSENRRWENVEPLGIEVRQSIFASNRNSILQDVVFLRYSILYKGFGNHLDTDSLSGVVFSIWNDVDIGGTAMGAADDLSGSDISLNAGYIYNDGKDDDWGESPPAVYKVIVQGPRVKTGNINDVGYNKLGPDLGMKEYEGYRNSDMNAYINYIGGDPLLSDPNYVYEARNQMLGLIGKTGELVDPCNWVYSEVRGDVDCEIIDPRFWYNGDPVTNVGWLCSAVEDQRDLISTEEFTLIKNEPMDIIVAYVVGQGSNALHSITKAREITQYVHEEYQRNFSTIVGVEDEPEEVVNSFSLSQNYPNPFNPTTIINFTIPPSPYQGEGQRVRLMVYDILGRRVKTLVNEVKSPGNYEVQFDASQLSSGVYFYRLTAGDFVQTKKMMLIK